MMWGYSPVCLEGCPETPMVCAGTGSFHQPAAIQQIAASSSIFERQSINGCLARVGNVTCFFTTCLLGIWALWAVLAAGLLKESNYLCVM